MFGDNQEWVSSHVLARELLARPETKVYGTSVGRLTVFWGGDKLDPIPCSVCGRPVERGRGLEGEQPRYHAWCMFHRTARPGVPTTPRTHAPG